MTRILDTLDWWGVYAAIWAWGHLLLTDAECRAITTRLMVRTIRRHRR